MPSSINLRKILNNRFSVCVIGATLIAMVLSFLLLQSRSLSRTGEGPAFFVLSAPETCWVEAKGRAGASQIYDVSGMEGVNEMALWLNATPAQAYFLQKYEYVSGQHIEIT